MNQTTLNQEALNEVNMVYTNEYFDANMKALNN